VPLIPFAVNIGLNCGRVMVIDNRICFQMGNFGYTRFQLMLLWCACI